MKAIKDIKPGEYLRLREKGEVWIRGEYDRGSKQYSIVSTKDMNRERFVKGNKLVITEFEY